VGVEGERWIPVHGMLPLSRARAAFSALEAVIGSHAADMQAAGVRHSWLISSPGAYITIEPMFFWRDELDPLRLKHLSERNRERFAGRPRHDAARELVARLRQSLRECFEAHDAVHAQTGRFYRHAQRLDPGSKALLDRLKQALDPTGQMNPGLLGLD
jgi:D-lactate dehydrogenase (cytochrome)